MGNEKDNRSPGSKFAEALLVGVLDAGARALSKAGESLASDAKKALRQSANKAELVEKGIEWWRKMNLGELDDVPGELKDNVPKGSA